ncbi:MAG: hypothetical protein QM619_10020 [Micropruina sp.]|uniref:hypothetical protein n=1 Tax=Micropruina sp. TaxID=2737536 RepID=UPI0039E2DAE3
MTNLPELANQLSDQLVGQPEWVQHAWGVLAAAGLVPGDPDPEHPNYADHLVTLAALAYLAGLVINDLSNVEPPEITGGAYGLDDITLGRYAERHGIYATEIPESAYQLGQDCVEARLTSVTRALAAEVGSQTLFAELWAQRDGEVDFPLGADELDEILNGGATGDKMAAYEWLMNLTGDR